MEDRAMVSSSTGSMNSLLDKLTKLKNRPHLIQELQRDLESLRKDLLDNFATQGAMDEQVKVWMKQVREVVYDIEDWIDQKPDINLGEESEAEEIEEFKAQIQEARDRCTSYGLIDKAPTRGAGSGDVRFGKLVTTTDSAHQLGLENHVLVGLTRQKDELVKHLIDDEHGKLKVVSIVGIGGLGKTTLAKEIYEELRLKFHCRAFVYVGQENPSIKTILQKILRQIRSRQDGSFTDWDDEQKVVAELWKLLGKKRYFIVLDGIWSIRTWRLISCALPDNNHGSRILIITRIKDVANSCSRGCTDVVHEMQALSKEDSERLFYSTISVGKETSLVGRKESLGDNYVLKICRGVPSAIIVAAGLFGRESAEMAPLKMLDKFVLPSADQGMRKVLQMSYADLSEPLKYCFVYLSLFPEDHTIKKDHLIRLWKAEGLIPVRDKESLWGIGVSYFNELINRRLIQPVFDFDDDQAVGCTVHGVMFDFIRLLSREENFCTTATELISTPFSCDAIRRFSLDCSNDEKSHTLASNLVHLSTMRSLTVFGDAEGVFDPPEPPSDSEDDEDDRMYVRWIIGNYRDLLSSFKLIRVLDLEDTKNLKDHHLKGIGGLVHLRYLGLGRTGIQRLPEEIGNLKQLETLDVRRNMLYHLPASLVELKRLVHLLLDRYHRKIHQILVKMQELKELRNIYACDSSELSSVAELVSKSKQLRILGVTLNESSAREADLLLSFLKVVVTSGLHTLFIHCRGFLWNDELVDLLLYLWEKVIDPSVTSQPQRDGKQTSQLQRFELRIYDDPLRRVPPNMASLVGLTHLHVKIRQLEEEDLRVLGGLHNLVLLNLSISPSQSNLSILICHRENYIIKKDVFPSLKVFLFTDGYAWSTSELKFAERAMTQLQRLGLSFKATRLQDKREFGIQNLTCLVRVHATIDCWSATISQVEAAEAYIRTQVSANPNRPRLELSRAHEDHMNKDEG